MQRFIFPAVLGGSALLLGFVVGRYVFPAAKVSSVNHPGSVATFSGTSARTTNPSLDSAAAPAAQVANIAATAPASSAAMSPVSGKQLVAQIKAALSRVGRQQVYLAITKLMDSVDASNVREALAFAQTLRPQEQSMRAAAAGRSLGANRSASRAQSRRKVCLPAPRAPGPSRAPSPPGRNKM